MPGTLQARAMKHPARHKDPAPRRTADAIRIVVVDDHPMVRERLAHVIEREGGMVVCGEAESRAEAADVITRTKPDLAIIDLTLRNSHGLELIKDLRVLQPKLKMLVVSLHDEALYAERSLHAGAHGYISKQDATQNILNAIRQVLAGDIYVSPSASRHILAKVAHHQPRETLYLSRLTDRELQVFEMIGQNLRNGEIAQQLGLGESSVETYRARIRKKLGLTDPAELVRQAIHWRQGQAK